MNNRAAHYIDGQLLPTTIGGISLTFFLRDVRYAARSYLPNSVMSAATDLTKSGEGLVRIQPLFGTQCPFDDPD